ncbi:MAG: DNA mismatch endonuclease Vsr [Caulobacter sp.]|nr:DNA mismatch endonuclease Vsr [Caulobacter sp.]
MTRPPRITSGVDPLTPEQRRMNMSRIRDKDTKPEMLLRRRLHAAGLRYRLHAKDLPGKPDLVFPGRRAVVFVHGCFWHGHDCPMFKLPATRQEFWREKIARNQVRDIQVGAALRELGWRTMTAWECALRGRARLAPSVVIEQVRAWLADTELKAEIRGAWETVDS